MAWPDFAFGCLRLVPARLARPVHVCGSVECLPIPVALPLCYADADVCFRSMLTLSRNRVDSTPILANGRVSCFVFRVSCFVRMIPTPGHTSPTCYLKKASGWTPDGRKTHYSGCLATNATKHGDKCTCPGEGVSFLTDNVQLCAAVESDRATEHRTDKVSPPPYPPTPPLARSPISIHLYSKRIPPTHSPVPPGARLSACHSFLGFAPPRQKGVHAGSLFLVILGASLGSYCMLGFVYGKRAGRVSVLCALHCGRTAATARLCVELTSRFNMLSCDSKTLYDY